MIRPSSAGSHRSGNPAEGGAEGRTHGNKGSDKHAKSGAEKNGGLEARMHNAASEDTVSSSQKHHGTKLTASGLTHGHKDHDTNTTQLTAAQLLHEIQDPFLKRFAAELEQSERQHRESNDRLKGLVGMQMEILGRVVMDNADGNLCQAKGSMDNQPFQTFQPKGSVNNQSFQPKGSMNTQTFQPKGSMNMRLHAGAGSQMYGVSTFDSDSATVAPATGATQQGHPKLNTPQAKNAFHSVVPETLEVTPAQQSEKASDKMKGERRVSYNDAVNSDAKQDAIIAIPGKGEDSMRDDTEDADLRAGGDGNGEEQNEEAIHCSLGTSEGATDSRNIVACLAIPGATLDNDHNPRSSNISDVPPLPPSQIRHGAGKSVTSETGDRCSDLLTFEILPVWKKKRKSTLNRLWKNSWQNEDFDTRNFARGLSFVNKSAEDDHIEHGWFDRYICARYFLILPNSKPRCVWDGIALMLVMYDTVYIPLLLFDPPETPFGLVMNWITRLFWSGDMPLSFITAYIRTDGATENSFPKMARRYIKTWLLPDIVVVGSDWLELIMSVDLGLEYARLGKASRFFRILRLIRLMRLIKMGQVLRLLQERLFSEIWVIGTEIVKRMLIILSFEHLCACIWYGIGARDVDMTWVKHVDLNFYKADLGERYFASLHWSLSQLGGGMDEIAPKNYGERVAAITVYLVSFIIAAIFVSGLTSSMTRLVILGSQQSQQLSGLRRYLLLNGISNGLMLRIQRNANYALSERQKFMPEGGVDLLHVISEPLRVELHFEIYSSVLTVHPFFQRYIEECPQVMRKVCHAGISTTEVSHGDVLFTVGEIPTRPKVYFQRSGELQYVSITGKVTQVGDKGWLSEAVLWCQWMHRGQLTAATDSRMVMLEAKVFQEIASEFDHHDFDPKVYASEFVEHLNCVPSTEISDLPISADGADYESLRRASVLSFGGTKSIENYMTGKGSSKSR